ncbi:hypothetical protein BKA61DRAFT_80474 [Leptodontidium sp. MPI-SDFR-AT-0119]|nr:hypothetical protein BKA61DRAFT_80474 [Leptodontidium sp. MPI-SDFR-AT-0119]
MDVATFAARPESYDRLSRAQISTFFSSNTSATREQCDKLAVELLAGPVSTTPIQGGTSYTVQRQQVRKVVQFRASKLDMVHLGIIQQVYDKFVPRCLYHGLLGSLHVYIWDWVSGPAFCRVRREMFTLDAEQRLSQTVQDFARFFASAWVNRLTVEAPPGLQAEYEAILDTLFIELPDSLRPTISKVRENLSLLFRPDFPMAVQHDDLLENNFHVEEATGHITGIVDWANAKVAPYGISLGGLEIVLGIQTNRDWYFHPSHVRLRQQFWNTFDSEIGQVSDLDRRSMEVARLMGLLRTHGIEWKDAMSGVYLERLILL